MVANVPFLLDSVAFTARERFESFAVWVPVLVGIINFFFLSNVKRIENFKDVSENATLLLLGAVLATGFVELT